MMIRFSIQTGLLPWAATGLLLTCGTVPAEEGIPADISAEDRALVEKLKHLDWDQLQKVEIKLDDTFDVFGGLLQEHKLSISTGTDMWAFKTPSATYLITAQDIEAMGARDLDEALRTIPGVHVRYMYNSVYTVRGLSSIKNAELLVLVNGVRLYDAAEGNKGAYWFGMPVQGIERIEVTRGPGSALYGADAFAGVINIITKTAGEIDGTEGGLRYGSLDTQDAWLLHGGRYGDVDMAVMLEYAHTNGPKQTIESDAQTVLDAVFGTDVSYAPAPYEGGIEAYHLRTDIGYRNWRLHAGYVSGADKGVGMGIVEAIDPEGFTQANRFDVDLAYKNPALIEHWDLTAQVRYRLSSWETKYVIYPPGAMGGAYPEGMIGIPRAKESQAGVDLAGFYNGFRGHVLGSGIGYGYADKYETGELNNLADGFSPLVENADTPAVFLPEVARNNWYIFLQDIWKISPQWELTAGVRFDEYDDFGSTVNPRAALIWRPQETFTVKLLYGEAFRAPAFGELYMANNPATVGNPNLKPEKTETRELAFDWRATEVLNLALNLFTYEVTDKIGYLSGQKDAAVLTAQNAGIWEGSGGEFEVRWKSGDRSSLLLNYAYQNAKDKDTKQKLGTTPDHQLYLRADWMPVTDWYLDTQINWLKDWSRLPGDYRDRLADTVTVDLTLRYKAVRNTPWNVAVGVRNLFDENVRSPSLGPDANGVINIPGDYPEAGRSYWAEVRYHFK